MVAVEVVGSWGAVVDGGAEVMRTVEAFFGKQAELSTKIYLHHFNVVSE